MVKQTMFFAFFDLVGQREGGMIVYALVLLPPC